MCFTLLYSEKMMISKLNLDSLALYIPFLSLSKSPLSIYDSFQDLRLPISNPNLQRNIRYPGLYDLTPSPETERTRSSVQIEYPPNIASISE